MIPTPKPILVFDFDDVLIDVTRSFLRFYKDKKKFDVDYEKIETDIVFPVKMTEEEELKLWDDFFESEEYLSLLPHSQTLAVLGKLKEKFDLVILTSRIERFRRSALAWIEKQLPDYFSKVLFAVDFPEGKREKGLICADLKAVMLVDDQPENILSCRECGISAVVYDRPWNRKLPPDFPRIVSLEQIERLLG